MTSTSRATGSKTQTPSLTRRDFFHDVAESLRSLLPDSLKDYQSNTTRNLLKISYGRSRIHYEVWANARDRHIEIGLHFEDGPDSTERLLRFFNEHIVEIKHELGPSFELERWTNSWGHLFQLLPYQPLTDGLTRDVTITLSRMIIVLQPLLAEVEAPPARHSVR